MAFPLRQLVPCLCTILLLLSIMSFSHTKANPCKCRDSDQDRRSNQTIGASAESYLIEDEDHAILLVDLDVLSTLPGFQQDNFKVLSTIGQSLALWQHRPGGLEVDEASFSVTIVYHPLRQPSPTGITFLIIPSEIIASPDEYQPYNMFSMQYNNSLHLKGTTSRSAIVSGSSVSITIGEQETKSWRTGSEKVMMAIVINMDVGSAFSYAVWIDYDHVGSRLSVYVEIEGKPKPDNTIAEVNLNISGAASDEFPSRYAFGLLSTVRQQLNVTRWDATVQDLPYYLDKGGFLSGKVTVLSSVLGSVAATATMATVLACYFSSRYRRWHKDLEQLARSMERLPGMPTKVEFADIKKATGNFHETMKLGGGGFGTVYRCTLPTTGSKTEQPIDVAVKRFTSDLQDRRSEDFLAEVSIINRLRHKNIAPLVGWSYNKGEPLLVFDYMTNGSLDQHLFSKGSSSSTSQRRNGATVLRWVTRYEIVRDIATGLHYVHHEYEPMVLHRDIKASNVMLDYGFRARLGDFGIACTVAVDRNSATGLAGTWGYIAPEYAMCGKATRQTDIYALGVLILEIVTGQRALASQQVINDDEIHISDRVWHFHREGSLTECVDAALFIPSSPEEDEQLYPGGEAERLLLLGLACSNPNPSDRPTMPDVVRVIAKSAPPPKVPPYKPRFVWPPPGEGHLVGSDLDSAGTSMMSYLDKSTTSIGEVQSGSVSGSRLDRDSTRGQVSFQLEHCSRL